MGQGRAAGKLMQDSDAVKRGKMKRFAGTTCPYVRLGGKDK